MQAYVRPLPGGSGHLGHSGSTISLFVPPRAHVCLVPVRHVRWRRPWCLWTWLLESRIQILVFSLTGGGTQTTYCPCLHSSFLPCEIREGMIPSWGQHEDQMRYQTCTVCAS